MGLNALPRAAQPTRLSFSGRANMPPSYEHMLIMGNCQGVKGKPLCTLFCVKTETESKSGARVSVA
jgi:hypothetical protein